MFFFFEKSSILYLFLYKHGFKERVILIFGLREDFVNSNKTKTLFESSWLTKSNPKEIKADLKDL